MYVRFWPIAVLQDSWRFDTVCLFGCRLIHLIIALLNLKAHNFPLHSSLLPLKGRGIHLVHPVYPVNPAKLVFQSILINS
jgi:hypothetical protein